MSTEKSHKEKVWEDLKEAGVKDKTGQGFGAILFPNYVHPETAWRREQKRLRQEEEQAKKKA
jgi:hypothetical protein